MRLSRSAEPIATPLHKLLGVTLLWLAWLSCTHATAEQNFSVRHAQTHLVEGVYLLDAELDLDFSDEALEALQSGVPLTVIVELQIVELRRYVWNKGVAKLAARNRLRVHALSGQYIVENLNSGASRAYRSLANAIVGLGTLDGFPMLDEYLLKQDKTYAVRVRARLDIEALPAPLRPVAYLSSLWRRQSEWSTWPIVR